MAERRLKKGTSKAKEHEDPVESKEEIVGTQTPEESGRSTRSTVGSSDTSGIDVRYDSPASTSGTSSGARSRIGESPTPSAASRVGRSRAYSRRQPSATTTGKSTTSAATGAKPATTTGTSAARGTGEASGAKRKVKIFETNVPEMVTTAFKAVKDKLISSIRRSPSKAESSSGSVAQQNPNLAEMLSSGTASASGPNDAVPLVRVEAAQNRELEEKIESSLADESSGIGDSSQGACGGSSSEQASGVRTRSMTREMEQQLSKPSTSGIPVRSRRRGDVALRVPQRTKRASSSADSAGSSTCDTATTSIDSEDLHSPDDGIVMQEDEQDFGAAAPAARPRRPRLTRQGRVTSEDETDEQGVEGLCSPRKKAAYERKDDGDSSSPG